MKQVIVDRLDKLFADAPFMKAGAVDKGQIDAAERDLGVVFSEDYRQFLANYGGALVGPYAVYGLARAVSMDQRLWSVVTVTHHFREQSWPGVDCWYVVSMDHAGNPVGIDKGGKVFMYDHDACEMIKLAESFEAFLENRLSNI